MGNTTTDEQQGADDAGERKLRGKSLDGAEQKNAVDHPAYEKARNPDTELRLDGEEDTLYQDGLEVEDDSETLADTRGNVHRG
jgi:hypothetical protein